MVPFSWNSNAQVEEEKAQVKKPRIQAAAKWLAGNGTVL